MKKTLLNLFTLLALVSLSNHLNAQVLFKDIASGTANSNPGQLTNVNGTMYFITKQGPNYNHQLWKSDGTSANTVLVKDSIIFTNIGGIITFIDVNGTLYYALNKNGSSSSATTTELWKTDGTTAGTVMITTLTNASPGGAGGSPPRNYAVVGNKFFFQMGGVNGLELWVSDGTAAGTKEVIDLNPGNNGGAAIAPMVAFNGKVYFSGSTSTSTSYKLYTSDGTAAGTTLVNAGAIDPRRFIVYKNELYFGANNNNELWKTDGTTAGTVKILNTSFNTARIINNELFYTIGGSLWKSDGSASGTVLVKDSVGDITGANSTYFFTSYIKSFAVTPFTMYYWQSDGTTAGTTRVSKKVGKSASFNVINNKMYNSVADSVGYTSGLWKSDGTDAGTTNLLTGVLSYLSVFNNNLFFTNFESANGSELWWLNAAAVGISEYMVNQRGLTIYPNPSTGIFTIKNDNISSPINFEVYNLLGEKILQKQNSTEIDLSNVVKGIYFVKITVGTKNYTEKIVVH